MAYVVLFIPFAANLAHSRSAVRTGCIAPLLGAVSNPEALHAGC